MADIISSIFGLNTPTQDARLADQQRNLDFGKLYGQATANPYADPARQQMYAQQQGAQAALGGELFNAVGSMFGMQSPQVQRATQLEQIMASTQQEVGTNDPTTLYPTLQKNLMAGGFQREAMQVGVAGEKAIQEFRLNNAKVGNEQSQGRRFDAQAAKDALPDNPSLDIFKTLAGKSSPASVSAAISDGFNISLLDSPEAVKMSPLAQQLVDRGIPYGSPEFGVEMKRYMDADASGKSKGSGNVSVNVGIDSGKLSEEAGKIVGKDAAAIEENYAALADFTTAETLLGKGIFAGAYGPAQMSIAKNTRQNLDKVSRTEQFKAHIASNVIKRLKDIGGNDTKEEREYLQSMVGGDISFEPSAILAVIKSGEGKIRNKITRTKTQVESANKGTGIPLDPLPKLQEGATTQSKSGKPIVVRNGKWEYQ